MTLQTLLLRISLVTLHVHAYIPAWPSNATLQRTGQINTSILRLQWHPNASDQQYVTAQSPIVRKANVDSPIQGIFVHFTEDSAGNETTTTPWIAFVSCDANSTNSSYETDIFTMAKDRGAKSVVLYSVYSETCIINPGYQSMVLDVFTTQTSNASRCIEYEFGQFGSSIEAHYGYFDAVMLNNAAALINDTITLHYPVAPGFLFAIFPTRSTDGTELQSNANVTGVAASTGNGGSQDTGVAMIVLYTITGCVSALFSAVIISGAIRAIRYPERYGPRAADPTVGGGQSRAGGLGRAILDTFPIVKFGSSANGRESGLARPKDMESAPIDTQSSAPVPLPDSVQLAALSDTTEHDEQRHDPSEEAVVPTTDREAWDDHQAFRGADQANLSLQVHTAGHGISRGPASPRERDPRMPECIGRETCPICIVDFEEGDDLRVLPCEGKHRFHQSCVDPWLLELSGSCPICRQDFHALETIISGELESEASPVDRRSEGGTSQTQNRFSRYLRFARRRQGRPGSGDQVSPLPPES